MSGLFPGLPKLPSFSPLSILGQAQAPIPQTTSPGLVHFTVAFQISPIILTGGIAANVTGGMIPIVSLTNSQNYDLGLLSQSREINLNDYFAHFEVAAGGTLVDDQIATYPFANQQVAANAVIVQPLRVSLVMISPVRQAGGYANKLQVMTALRASLLQHNLAGGTYTVATPSYLYTDCLLVSLRDVSGGDSKQVQHAWQWDFVQPLVTSAQAAAAQNNLMSHMTRGLQIQGDPPSYSGPEPAVGSPTSAVAPSVVPAALMPAGAGVAGSAFAGGPPGNPFVPAGSPAVGHTAP